jgi:hypothetical protein
MKLENNVQFVCNFKLFSLSKPWSFEELFIKVDIVIVKCKIFIRHLEFIKTLFFFLHFLFSRQEKFQNVDTCSWHQIGISAIHYTEQR